ncbi:MAG: glycoside hydrolase family 99-like domain-containing protein [Ilumatobacter sp.]|nr:glycoside hydrolase family 99-like domain-containing protein [Ilumatobacter sp.]
MTTGPRPGRRPANLAFYLPQFHPIEQNDAWWEPGFTEWHNVARARPMYEGQRVGRLPGALGFYDLRVPETRRAQIALARQAGIDGFMYYHYWFHGHRLLHEPLDRMLESPEEDFPFCLCWANEPWTRRWDGMEHDVLMSQQYSEDDDLAHIHYLRRVFTDRRYLRLHGRPVLFVYRPASIPNVAHTMALWRWVCREHGEPEPYLIRFDTYAEVEDPAPTGFDAAAEFVPHGALALMEQAGTPARDADDGTGNLLLDYQDLAGAMLTRPKAPWRRYRCVTPNWDNSPRRTWGDATITVGSTPERFADWARRAQDAAVEDGDELLLFNAWNEWAEGANLEPDAVDGTAYLDALAAALAPRADLPPATDPLPPRPPSPLDGVGDGELRRRLETAEATLARRAVRWPLAIARRLRGS